MIHKRNRPGLNTAKQESFRLVYTWKRTLEEPPEENQRQQQIFLHELESTIYSIRQIFISLSSPHEASSRGCVVFGDHTTQLTSEP